MRFPLVIAAVAAIALSGCSTTRPAAVAGCCYSDVQSDVPTSVTAHVGSSKVGTAKAVSYLGWFGMGDASLNAAAKSAGITKINYVDYHVKNIFGIVGEYTTYVYGE